MAALFGGLHPLGVDPGLVAVRRLLVGADKMQRAVQVPSALIDTLLGLVVLFVVGSQMRSRNAARRQPDRAGSRPESERPPRHDRPAPAAEVQS